MYILAILGKKAKIIIFHSSNNSLLFVSVQLIFTPTESALTILRKGIECYLDGHFSWKRIKFCISCYKNKVWLSVELFEKNFNFEIIVKFGKKLWFCHKKCSLKKLALFYGVIVDPLEKKFSRVPIKVTFIHFTRIKVKTKISNFFIVKFSNFH